ncbi:hypothetical protein 015DV004_235 [Bacillus phage 015DV004]|nr:hypothetical protein 015DV004_235 [Bacillus phage 015DV004]
MIDVTVQSLITGRIRSKSYTGWELLRFVDEADLIDDLTFCECKPIGETYEVGCNCDLEWEDVVLTIDGISKFFK